MTKTKKLMLSDIEAHDERYRTSLKRELEMVVEALVPRGYVIQFFDDCRVSGLKAAKCYLLNFVSTKYGHTRSADEDRFNETYNRIINLF